MVEYSKNMKTAYIDGYKFERDDKTGYYLSTRKIGSKRKRLHVYIWEKFNGSIPKGYQVHHIEFDKSKNEIKDLQLLTRHEHLSLHAQHQTAERRRNFQEAGIKAAPKWHRSKAGHEWHKEHYERMKSKLHVEHEYICLNCGKTFKSTQVNSKFCSNNCKSSWRRKLGVDNEIRTCAVCGKPFSINKYSKGQCCSRECSAEFHRDKIHKACRERKCLQYASQKAS